MINDDLPVGATRLTLDDLQGFIPKGISTRGQLDQFESRNIQQSLIWARRGNKKPSDILNIHFCLELHKRMFDKTWEWAGKIRRHEVNIGRTPSDMVSVSLVNLCNDAQAWIKFNTYVKDELCIRLHYRMVHIHPFPNGNGRHSRIMADLLAVALGLPVLTWGNKTNLSHFSKTRRDYILALKQADIGNFKFLLKFAKS